MIDPGRILLIPSLRRGNGTGHLKRCLDYMGGAEYIHLHILKDSPDGRSDGEVMKTHPLLQGRHNLKWLEEPGGDWDLVLLDQRSTPKLPPELKGIPVLALDERGALRNQAACTVDMIPGTGKGLPRANLQGESFLKKDVPRRKECSGKVKNILVSFGGEDPAELAFLILEILPFLKGHYSFSFAGALPQKIFNLAEAAEADTRELENSGTWVKILGFVPDLAFKMASYDLVITSFGLSAFEALSGGVPILLLNPTAYHDSLSIHAGLPFVPGVWKKRRGKKKLARCIEKKLNEVSLQRLLLETWAEKKPRDFPSWFQSLNISRDSCPVCGSLQRNSLERFENKSYFRCTSCSMVYMVQLRMNRDIYTEEYFFSDYKKQYGKTYLEDFDHIASMGDQRLERIFHAGGGKGELLDIGCAYGPFLLRAKDRGYRPQGLEISRNCIDYLKKKHPDIPVFQGDLDNRKETPEFPAASFDVITLWYVIEHFQNLDFILPKIFQWLKPGGVLAFSTPHGGGISARKDRKSFLKASPEDHYTIWDKKNSRKILKNQGFHKIRFHVTGHHPERFPGILKFIPPSWRLGISKTLGLGDTFEVYALKKEKI